jgi:hypothetical protein
MGLDPHRVPVGADGNGPVGIGAKHQGIELPIALDDGRVWVSEPAVALHRKHRDLRIDGADKGLKAGSLTAVMGDFDNSRPQIAIGLEQEAFGFPLQIAGEQHADATKGQLEDE